MSSTIFILGVTLLFLLQIFLVGRNMRIGNQPVQYNKGKKYIKWDSYQTYVAGYLAINLKMTNVETLDLIAQILNRSTSSLIRKISRLRATKKGNFASGSKLDLVTLKTMENMGEYESHSHLARSLYATYPSWTVVNNCLERINNSDKVDKISTSQFPNILIH